MQKQFFAIQKAAVKKGLDERLGHRISRRIEKVECGNSRGQ